MHRGVYAVGHLALLPRGFRLAAVLACGEGAVVSHASAAAHLDMRATAAARFDVTIARGSDVRRPGIRVFRRALPPDEHRGRAARRHC